MRVRDVALAAGVSVATVSRAFNFPDSVSEPARRSVFDAAARLGYRPNAAAKALRLRRSHLVGAVFPTTDHGLYSVLLSSFQERMRRDGYLCVMVTVGFDNSRMFEPVRQLLDGGVEALMVVGRIDDHHLLAHLLEHRIPVVSTYSSIPDAPFASVGADNHAATTLAMRHLLGLGHRHFAMLAGPTAGNDRQQARRRAFVDALRDAGIHDPPLIFEDTRGYSLGYAIHVLHTLVERHPDVTAIVCNSDYYGLAVLTEARRLGIDVPGRLSVVGVAVQEIAALLDPPLTTLSVRASEMGLAAAETLIAALAQQPVAGRVLPATLVVRGSTGVVPMTIGPGRAIPAAGSGQA